MPEVATMACLTGEQWRQQRAAHEARVDAWIEPRLQRRREGSKHPTDDFMFEYYPNSPSKLRSWHPGFGVVLEDADEFLESDAYMRLAGGVTASIAPLTPKLPRLKLAISILEGTARREPVTGCFALHEWAMVYGLEPAEVRHNQLPLRLTPLEIRETVDALGLRCTHIDAYRFFTPQVQPMNTLVPTRATQPDLEQPGCLHATMDLYKYAFWFSPLVSSELIADCFELARTARDLDMQASPYDSTELGLEPIRIETPEGRLEYAQTQRELMQRTAPLRQRLMSVLSDLRSQATF